MGRTRLSLILFFGLVVVVTSCGKKQDTAVRRTRQPAAEQAPAPNRVRVVQPANDARFPLGSILEIQLGISTDTLSALDSVQVFVNNDPVRTFTAEPYSVAYAIAGGRLGSRTVKAVTWYADGRRELDYVNIIVLADTPPEKIAYRIRNVYPHDVKAYTQGLVFEDGYLYEGTGQYKESSLRKTEITTGEVIRIMNLPGDIFGEGIAIVGDRIYQLTYRSQVGFVYEKESFRRLQKIYYQNKEGWGLTYDGRHLIKSDGSHRIYFMDTVYFTEVRQIEVYNEKGPVSRLNELEYIEGRIFANIYGEENIVIIDPDTGKVLGELNMQGILPAKDHHRRLDVFNGIAWDPEEQLMYVTGKYWPKLFEIQISDPF